CVQTDFAYRSYCSPATAAGNSVTGGVTGGLAWNVTGAPRGRARAIGLSLKLSSIECRQLSKKIPQTDGGLAICIRYRSPTRSPYIARHGRASKTIDGARRSRVRSNASTNG